MIQVQEYEGNGGDGEGRDHPSPWLGEDHRRIQSFREPRRRMTQVQECEGNGGAGDGREHPSPWLRKDHRRIRGRGCREPRRGMEGA